VNGIYKHKSMSGATSRGGRQTGITNFAERDVGMRVLIELTGQSNMAIAQHYINLRPTVLKVVV
jgi:hypothetical protein